MMGSVPWDDHGVATLVQARHVSATLPIVLCAPHGGNAVDGDQAETLLERPSASPPTNNAAGVGEGSRAIRGGAVSLIADVGTLQLVEELDKRLTRKFTSGEGFVSAVDAPAVVAARFHRKYVDANRPLDEKSVVAVHPSCLRAKEVHEYYHGAIETAVSALGSRAYGKAGASRENGLQEGVEGDRQIRLLLLDVHGQCKFVDKVLVGTCNGLTADLEALNAPGKGFLWHLRRNLNSNDEIQGVRAGNADKIRDGNRPQVDRRAEVGEGVGEEHKQAWATERASLGDQDGGEVGRGHKAGGDESVVVLPLYGHEELSKYTGGYTVRRHGVSFREGVASSEASTGAAGCYRNGEEGHTVAVDAVQLEFGSLLRRTSEARTVVAEAVATAVFDFIQNQADRP